MRIKPLYLYLKLTCPIALRIYFRKFNVSGRKNIPWTGPVIFAPNHQNAFMDAVIVGATGKRHPWFLTRASVFKSAVARFWLGAMQMIPIYRFRDGLSNVKRNDEVINRCVSLLARKGALLIFPEGNHDRKWQLRPLQKGIARIAFAAEAAYNWTLDVKIVPTGIQYSDHTRFQSEAFCRYNQPITVSAYKELYEEDPLIATEALLNDLAPKISELIVDIQDKENYESIRAGIQEKLYPEKKKLPVALKVLLSPVLLYGYLNHLIPYHIDHYIIRHLVKDDHFKASIKFGIGWLLVPVFYLIQSVIFYQITNHCWLTLLYLISLPISGLLTYRILKQ